MKKTIDLVKRYTYKKKNGITLIALIITIVVMLILATVTIGTINGGLFGYTKKAKVQSEIKDIKEQLDELKVFSETKIKDGTINDILKIDSPYNDRLKIEDEKLVYVASKWSEKEMSTLEEMGIAMSLYDFYKQNAEIFYIANASTKTAKYSDLGNVNTLEYFRDEVNAGTFKLTEAKLIEDIKLNEGKYTVTSEGITFSEDAIQWTPISNKFTGTLDGQDFSISGLYISTGGTKGLFSELKGTIKNLTIKNSSITVSTQVGGAFSGSVLSTGIIEDCCNESYVVGHRIGGLVGHNDGIIRNSYNNIELTTTGQVGGIAGQGGGTIENCWNNKDITGSSNNGTGGIAGTYNGTIKECYNFGKITAQCFTGGICGSNGGIIEKCYNDGEIVGNNFGVGGIAGGNSATVKECFNKKTVFSNIYRIGGIVGDNTGSVINCYNSGDLTGTRNTYTGGIVGQNSNANKTPTVQNCYNTGIISSTKTNVGSLVGNNGSTSTVTDCYSLTSALELFGTDASETTENCAKKTQAEMQAQDNSFISLLNAGLTTNVWLVRANNYPKLSWEQ